MSNHVDRLYAAVSVLAGHGHIKQRLISAYEDHLNEIDDEDLPLAVNQTFADLRTLMHRVTPLKGESPVCASVRKMSVAEASDCAVSIVDLYREVSLQDDNGRATVPIVADDPKPVPPFLVKNS